MTSTAVPNALFITIWNSCNSRDEFCKTTGLTPNNASGRASQLRLSGIDLKRYRRSSLQASCCVCGKIFKTYIYLVAKGRGKFCSVPCSLSRPRKDNAISGARRERLYGVWWNMNDRCSNPNNRSYRSYGGAGVSVCEEWRLGFVAFCEWALSSGYSDGLSIDRRDANENYEPSNCRWATSQQQHQNTRKLSKYSTSKFKGVSWDKRSKRWVARLAQSGRKPIKSFFASEVDAAKEYDRMALAEYGEFACLNFKV